MAQLVYFIIGFIYRTYVLRPRSGRQVSESGAEAPVGFLAALQIVRLLSNVKSVA